VPICPVVNVVKHFLEEITKMDNSEKWFLAKTDHFGFIVDFNGEY